MSLKNDIIKNIKKHQEVANELLKNGFAYKCYCTEEEIKEQKENVKKKEYPMFIIENGEILKILKFQRTSNL